MSPGSLKGRRNPLGGGSVLWPISTPKPNPKLGVAKLAMLAPSISVPQPFSFQALLIFFVCLFLFWFGFEISLSSVLGAFFAVMIKIS